MDKAREELLVVRCQLGERQAFAELVAAWHPRLWTYVRWRVGGAGAAEDVVQEIWVAVVRNLPRLRRTDQFAPWLYTIASRAVTDHRRRIGARPAEVPLEAEPVADDPIGGSGVLDRPGLVRGLRELPAVDREALVLFHLGDLPLDEVARMVDAPVGTVKSRLARARRVLRDRMSEQGEQR